MPKSNEKEMVLKLGYRICRKCGQGVERSEGCHHMTCICGHEYCNKCGADFKGVE